jgi:hypothetical protein
MTAQWQQLVNHVMSIPEQIYETWNSSVGWDNHTQFGKEFGWDGVAWCAIFDWDMYNDCGLAAIVPKTASVSAMSDWAQRHGQWSEYPSIGAWVNFNDGAHTEIVVGFDETNVYTKGGNSVKAGATDAGQGNGVWSHQELRKAQRVTGYFAPKFSDNICPPTADPNDYRGGKPVSSWRWTAPIAPVPPKPPAIPAFPGRNWFKPGANNAYVTQLGKQLVKKGFGKHYAQGPGPRWSEADRLNVQDFQRSRKELAGDADGYPGPLTWRLLFS